MLFERRPALGGLTSSIRRHGLSFDNGQHVFLRCCTAYLELLDRLGAREQVVPAAAARRARAGAGRRTSLDQADRTARPAPSPRVTGTVPPPVAARAAQLARPALALRRLDPDDATLDNVSFGAWLASQGQSERAIDRLWDLIVLPTLNVPAGEASLALAAKVFRTGLLDRSDGGDIGWATVPLAQLHGANAARALDAAGVETVLGAAVGSIDRSPSGSFTIVCGARRTAGLGRGRHSTAGGSHARCLRRRCGRAARDVPDRQRPPGARSAR